MQTRIILLAFVAALGIVIAVGAPADEPSWPDREEGLAWPKPRSAAKILDERFTNASTNALGSATDIAAIKSAIAASKSQSRVTDIRWLSPRLVMAKVRLPESGWYYVIEKKGDEWLIRIYYLKWIA